MVIHNLELLAQLETGSQGSQASLMLGRESHQRGEGIHYLHSEV